MIGSLPSPADVRALAKLRETVEVVNICAWWRGYEEQYTQLGIKHTRMSRTSIDPSEVVEHLRKLVTLTKPDRQITVLLHCESGFYAAATAAGATGAVRRAADRP